MTRRRVYLSAGAAHSAAGDSLAQTIAACLRPAEIPPRLRLQTQSAAVDIPYFPLQSAVAEEQRLQDLVEDLLQQAHLTPEQRRRTGLFLGTSSAMVGIEEQQMALDWAQGKDILAVSYPYLGELAERVARNNGLNGHRQTITTACSASANALLYAGWMIREGLLDHALVIGVEFNNRISLLGFSSLLLVAPERCRPFDATRAGVVLGEAVSAVLLTAQGADARWEILGGGTLCDTSHPTSPAPGKIADTLLMALQDAQLDADAITAIKAHGTGTPSNDQAEGLGIRAVLGDAVPVTSLKPVFGHTLGACGVLETLAYTGCIDQGYWPATGGFSTPDAEIRISPLRVNTAAKPGAILCNYFGFGGNNCSLVLRPC